MTTPRRICAHCIHHEQRHVSTVPFFRPGLAHDDHLHVCRGVKDTVSSRRDPEVLCREARDTSGQCGPAADLYQLKRGKKE
jgi:hypothetical protein